MNIEVRDFYLEQLFWANPVRREEPEGRSSCCSWTGARSIGGISGGAGRPEAKLHDAIRLARGQVERGSES